MTERTYFGLEIISGRGVRPADIARLPFADFWGDSAVGSTQAQDQVTGEWLVYLHDWNNFCELFIKTGRHRHMVGIGGSAWAYWEEDIIPTTFFGLEVIDGGKIREADIAQLPFYNFWCSGIGAVKNDNSRLSTGGRLLPLTHWEAFSRHFIKTGQHPSTLHPDAAVEI